MSWFTQAIRAIGAGPILNATERATTLPSGMNSIADITGSGAPAPTVPEAPPLAPPATQPTAKAGKKGIQQSFLSGVAASALGGSAGSSGGKTLLGA